jgi:hypothetical protein
MQSASHVTSHRICVCRRNKRSVPADFPKNIYSSRLCFAGYWVTCLLYYGPLDDRCNAAWTSAPTRHRLLLTCIDASSELSSFLVLGVWCCLPFLCFVRWERMRRQQVSVCVSSSPDNFSIAGPMKLRYEQKHLMKQKCPTILYLIIITINFKIFGLGLFDQFGLLITNRILTLWSRSLSK